MVCSINIKQILYGTYSPLNRFMDLDEIKSVLNQNHLRDGVYGRYPLSSQLKQAKGFFEE